MSDFHQSKAWRKLAADHKALKCACGSKTDIQSAHYLPQKQYPLMRLWRVNLYHACGKCNNKLGNNIKWSIRASQLWVLYWMIKGIGILLQLLATAFFITLLIKDISAGGMETSFTGQIIIETWEAIEELVK